MKIFNLTHWAQAKCYAYIFAVQNDLPEIAVQLTYFNLETSQSKKFNNTFKIAELKEFVSLLIEKYSVWAGFSIEWEKIRNYSIKMLEFPFPAYRKGQRELAVYTYRTIAGGKKLFAQAPTGTGKTLSVLFPAVKAGVREKPLKYSILPQRLLPAGSPRKPLRKCAGPALK